MLRAAKACGVYTKSSIMLGLGESDDEIIDTMLDLKVRLHYHRATPHLENADGDVHCCCSFVGHMIGGLMSHSIHLSGLLEQAAGVEILTFGQYLQPTPLHLEVTEYIPPEKFEHWRRYGEDVIGFRSLRKTFLWTSKQTCSPLLGRLQLCCAHSPRRCGADMWHQALWSAVLTRREIFLLRRWSEATAKRREFTLLLWHEASCMTHQCCRERVEAAVVATG